MTFDVFLQFAVRLISQIRLKYLRSPRAGWLAQWHREREREEDIVQRKRDSLCGKSAQSKTHLQNVAVSCHVKEFSISQKAAKLRVKPVWPPWLSKLGQSPQPSLIPSVVTRERRDQVPLNSPCLYSCLLSATICGQLPFSWMQSCEGPGSGRNVREFEITATLLLANVLFTKEVLQEFVFFVEEWRNCCLCCRPWENFEVHFQSPETFVLSLLLNGLLPL